MPQHLQMTCITVKGFATMEAVISLTQCSCESHLVSLWLHDLQLGKIKNILDALQLPLLFWGNNRTTFICWSWFQSLSPSLMQLPELKRAVTCDKNSGCRLHEQRRSEFAFIFSANVAVPSCPWPINFLRSSYFAVRRTVKLLQ